MTLMQVDQHRLMPSFTNMWEDFFSDTSDKSQLKSWASMPAVNIKEDEKAFIVSLAAPGMQREDFHVEVDNGVLSIASEKQAKHEEKDEAGKYTRQEFSYHTFKRSFTLPDAIRTDKIEASYKDGILAIHLPKKEEATLQHTKQIAVK